MHLQPDVTQAQACILLYLYFFIHLFTHDHVYCWSTVLVILNKKQ